MTVNAVRLNHAVLFVADLERSLAFYQTAFDMQVVAREPPSQRRLPAAAPLGQPPRPRPVRRRHPDAASARQHRALPPRVAGGHDRGARHARQTLANLDAYTGESSHGATKSVYGADPDGNEFEVMWMLPKASWGEYADAAPVERLDLAAEVRTWGGTRTAAELVPVDTP